MARRVKLDYIYNNKLSRWELSCLVPNGKCLFKDVPCDKNDQEMSRYLLVKGFEDLINKGVGNMTNLETMDEVENEVNVTDVLKVAKDLYSAGNKEGAIALVRDTLGDNAAKEAETAMMDKVKACDTSVDNDPTIEPCDPSVEDSKTVPGPCDPSVEDSKTIRKDVPIM